MTRPQLSAIAARPAEERLILLDMDGVITSERGYWDAAAGTLIEFLAELGATEAVAALPGALAQPALARTWLPETIIAAVKNRAINTNWDLAFLAVSWHLIDLLARRGHGPAPLAFGAPTMAFSIDRLRPVLAGPCPALRSTELLGQEFLASCGSRMGYDVLFTLAEWAQARLGQALPWFDRSGPLWAKCFDLFQHWYLGTTLAAKDLSIPATAASRKGIAFDEPLVLPPEKVLQALAELRTAGFTLGIATGRCRLELDIPLQAHGLTRFFEPRRIATHDDIARAEAELRAAGRPVALSKPHPFCFLRALHPDLATAALADPGPELSRHAGAIIVGDTVGDMRAGRRIGATTVAVLTGVAGKNGRTQLVAAGADYIIDDLSQVARLLRTPISS